MKQIDIRNNYHMNSKIIKEYVDMTMSNYANVNIVLALICIGYGMYHYLSSNTQAAILWIGIGVFLGIGLWFCSKRNAARRMAKRYERDYGRVDAEIKIHFGHKDNFSFCVEGQKEQKYLYKAIAKIKESPHLMVLRYPMADIIIAKDYLSGGDVEALKQLLFAQVIKIENR